MRVNTLFSVSFVQVSLLHEASAFRHLRPVTNYAHTRRRTSAQVDSYIDRSRSFRRRHLGILSTPASRRLHTIAGDNLEVELAPIEPVHVDQASDEISYGTMLRFVVPTLGIWVAGPLLSLVDTGVVGIGSSLELAALGPATTLCDSFLYCFSFLAVATTNLLATAIADSDKEESQRVVSHALAIAVCVGIGIVLVVQGFGAQMMALTAGSNPEVIPAALKYSYSRIWGAPFCLASMIAQAACLGSRDSLTPLMVVLACCSLNGLGDWLCVCKWGLGIKGAALATAASEMLSMILLVRAVALKQGKRLYPFIKLPGFKDLKKFMSFAGPVFIALLGKIICYTSMTMVATGCGSSRLAAHTCMLKIFFFFTTFGDSLSQTAQAFLPGMLARDLKRGAAAVQASVTPPPRAANLLIRKVLLLGVAVGGANACLAGLVPLKLPHLFTYDAVIKQEMRGLVPLLSWSLLSHACVMGLEGILLAKRELGFLAKSYIFNTALIVLILEHIKSWGPLRGLHGVWAALLWFQVARCGLFGLRLLWVKHKERKIFAEHPGGIPELDVGI